MLTDVTAVEHDWGSPCARAILCICPTALREMDFPPGSMGPKVQAACQFVDRTGATAGIGRLTDAAAILAGDAGTLVVPDREEILWWPET